MRFASPGDEPGMLEHFQVLRYGGHGHLERFGEFRDGGLAGNQASQDGAPSGIGEGREGAAEVIVLHFVLHHKVK